MGIGLLKEIPNAAVHRFTHEDDVNDDDDGQGIVLEIHFIVMLDR